jgi:competence protein ComEC
LAIVIGGVLWACRWLGLGRRLAPLVAGVAVAAFVIVARPEPSVLRATVMGMIGLLAMLTGRQRQGLPALCAAVLLLVLIDPSLARSYGFALSVLATAGLLVLAPVWRERLRRRMPGFAADALAVAGAAEVAVAPVLVMLSGEVGLVSVAANLLAAPAVAPATLLGAIAGLTAPFALPVARVVVWPAGLAVGWIVWVARTASGLPYAVVPWPGGGWGVLTLIVAGGCAAVVLRWRRARILGAAAMAGVLIAVIGLRLLAAGWPPPGWVFVACDVGQGDGLVLSAGPGQAVVIDAGPDPALMDACLTRLRVRDVPLLVLSHPHADHVDGVGGVRHGRKVGTVVTTPRTSGREARFVSGLAGRAATAGQRWSVGDLTLEVLGPLTDGPRLLYDDDGTTVNNASVVMVARRPGFGVLLPGDVETEAQRALVASVPHVQVLKVPHHGSRSQDPAFLAAAHAGISIVSVGRDNDYGHPAPATIAMLQRLGTHVYRTDLSGDIAVTRTAGGLAVVPHRT